MPQEKAPTEVLQEDTRLFRIHLKSRGALWFGPGEGKEPRYRFDAPDGSFGVCYLTGSPAGAFAGTFLRDPRPGTAEDRILPVAMLDEYACAEVKLTADVEVADLKGPGLAWRGVTAAVSSTPCEASHPGGPCRHDSVLGARLLVTGRVSLHPRYRVLRKARRQLIPFAEAQGIYTDEDVFTLIS